MKLARGIFFKSRLKLGWVILGFMIVTSGCMLGYLTRVGVTQASLLLNRVPLWKMEREGRFTPEQSRKVALVQEAREFGEKELGYRETKNYTLYADIGSDFHVTVLSAAPKDALQPYLWRFPIIGEVPYLGFFDIEEARKEAKKLEEEGYDLFLRDAGAFSTLGWLRDPIYPHMLDRSDVRLANLILHELVHATLYLKGEAAFNESLATYIGNEGTILFFESRGDEASREEAAQHARDALRFGRFLGELYEGLQEHYAKPISREEKIAERDAVFERFRARFKEIPFEGESYRGFGDVKWNNARIIASGLYLRYLPRFYRFAEREGLSLKEMLPYFIELSKKGRSPLTALEGEG